MLENLKALVAVIVIAIIIFKIAKPAFATLLSEEQVIKYRNTFIALSLVLFLAHNFWLYVFLSVVILQFAQLREANKILIYFVVLFALPPVWQGVGGQGSEALVVFNSSRMLALGVLLPIALTLARQKDSVAFGSTTPDKLLLAYVCLFVAMKLRDTSLTNTIRHSMYAATDILLPYYAVSRSLRNMSDFKAAIAAFILATLVMSGAAIYEYASFHLLYGSLGSDLSAHIELTIMVARDHALRAVVTSGQPIVLGYVVMVGIGFFLFLQRYIPNFYMRLLLLVVLAGGSFAAISRGPWIGILILLLVYLSLGHKPIKSLAILVGCGALAFTLAVSLPGGAKLINLLPFIGKVESENVVYREQLLSHALIVIARNPLLGSTDYINTPEMKEMVQGQGIIDVVNSYLGILLENGLVGLLLFVGFFFSILWGIGHSMRQFPSRRVENYMFDVKRIKVFPDARKDEQYILGITLLAILVAILVTIYTVSSITLIPLVYWCVAGMGVAYTQMLKQKKA
jgi:hypothetical protein